MRQYHKVRAVRALHASRYKPRHRCTGKRDRPHTLCAYGARRHADRKRAPPVALDSSARERPTRPHASDQSNWRRGSGNTARGDLHQRLDAMAAATNSKLHRAPPRRRVRPAGRRLRPNHRNAHGGQGRLWLFGGSRARRTRILPALPRPHAGVFAQGTPPCPQAFTHARRSAG